jgi:hypothetical protein
MQTADGRKGIACSHGVRSGGLPPERLRPDDQQAIGRRVAEQLGHAGMAGGHLPHALDRQVSLSAPRRFDEHLYVIGH